MKRFSLTVDIFLYKTFPSLFLKGSYFCKSVFPSILQSGGCSRDKSLLITTKSPDWKNERFQELTRLFCVTTTMV